MSTAYSARKLLDPSAKKQRVKLVSSKVAKVQPFNRPRRTRSETVNTSGRKTAGKRVEFREDEMEPAPRKETVHCSKIPVAKVRPPRSRIQVKHDPTMPSHPPQPQVTSQRNKIPDDCQKQAQTHWKPRHPRTKTPKSETVSKRSRTPVTAEVPKLSGIQREQPTKSSSSTPAQNGTSSRVVAARNRRPACIPLRHNYPRNTTSRVLCPPPTTKRPAASCAAPENRYGTRNIKPGYFHTHRPALRTCLHYCVMVFPLHSGSTFNEELNRSLRG